MIKQNTFSDFRMKANASQNKESGSTEIRIKHIIFDYGGVISLPQDEKLFKRMVQLSGLETEQFQKRYSMFRDAYDSGLISGREYWERIVGEKQKDPRDINGLLQLDIESWTMENPRTIECINELKTKGVSLGVLSNMPVETLEHVKSQQWFGTISLKLFSCDLGICKPDKRIYEMLLKRLNAESDEVLFIDDSSKNTTAASEEGIHTIHFQNSADVCDRIKNFFGKFYTRMGRYIE